MKAGAVILIVAVMLLTVWFLGLLLTAIIGVFVAFGVSLIEKYVPTDESAKAAGTWRCSNCGRLNAARAKICTRCGFKKPLMAESKEKGDAPD
jgi:uncharacterized paraquat-inducible protein A